MPAPHKLTRRLQELLGDEASDHMADWMNQTESELGNLRHELAEFRQEMRADFAEIRQEMNVRFAEIRQEMNVTFAELRQEMNARFAAVDAEFADVRREMGVGFSAAEAAAAKRHADFMKWTLGFWAASLVTMVAAIAALAQVLR
jgi:predicted  nucleic acid-binding Zn-ribbon protein